MDAAVIAARLSKEYVQLALPEFLGMIEAAVELDPARDSKYVLEQIAADKFSPWIVLDDDGSAVAAGVTKIDLIGTEKHLTIMYCGGGGVPWRDMIAEVEEHAREEGCASVRIEGRPGWARMLRENGYINKPFLEKRL